VPACCSEMDYSGTSPVEVEIDVDVDTSIGHDELWSPYSTSSVRVADDDRASVSSAASAARWKHPYTIVAYETTPLLQKPERMSAQLSSPIEIAGIEGQDGSAQPWLRALEAKRRRPWWETPSVSRVKISFTQNDTDLLGILAASAFPSILLGHGRGQCSQIERHPKPHLSTIPFRTDPTQRIPNTLIPFYNWRRQPTLPDREGACTSRKIHALREFNIRNVMRILKSKTWCSLG
jgi:hypothetical protein